MGVSRPNFVGLHFTPLYICKSFTFSCCVQILGGFLIGPPVVENSFHLFSSTYFILAFELLVHGKSPSQLVRELGIGQVIDKLFDRGYFGKSLDQKQMKMVS